jgi:predicted tellurium resistance membrane protein TerC
VQRYPPLVDGAFIIIAWVGIKLLVEYLHQIHVIAFEIPKWLSLGLIVVIFGIAFFYARRKGPVAVAGHDDETANLLQDAVESAPAEPRANVPVERGERPSPRG